MQYKLLGRSGLRVSEIALGTMTFGDAWGWGADKATSQAIFDVFAEAGGTFIDTANVYTDGDSERYIGDFVAADRDHFVLATKYTLMDKHAEGSDPNKGGNNRKNMIRSVEASLKRLNTDYIDLFYLHMWDFTTPIEEVLRGMDDLVRQGKVLYVGFSDSPAWVVSRAVTLAEQRGYVRPCVVQLPYNVLNRAAEREILPMAEALDLAVTPWAVLGGGVLTGKYNVDNGEPRRYEGTSERSLRAGQFMLDLAAEIGATPAQIALAWVRQQGQQVIPLIGARKPAHLTDSLGALEVTLSEDVMARLDELAEFELGFPLSFLHGDHVRELIFGQTFPLIQNHRPGW